MKIKIIKTDAEYEQALARADALMDAPPGSSQEEELELIALLIEKYEDEHFPIDFPDPIERGDQVPHGTERIDTKGDDQVPGEPE